VCWCAIVVNVFVVGMFCAMVCSCWLRGVGGDGVCACVCVFMLVLVLVVMCVGEMCVGELVCVGVR
jgi:hypothetical protein